MVNMVQKEFLNNTLVNIDKLKATKKFEHDFIYGLEEKEESNLLKNFLIAESDLCNPFQVKDYEKILDKNNNMLYYDISYFPAFQKLLFDLFLINFLSKTKLSFLVDGFTGDDMDNQDFLFGFINYFDFNLLKYSKTAEKNISNYNVKSMPNNSKIISFRRDDVDYLIMEQSIKGLKLLQKGSKDQNLLLRFNHLKIPFNVASDKMKEDKLLLLESSFRKNLERLLNENNDFELYLNLFIPNFVNYVLTLMQTILNSVFASMLVGDFDLKFLKHVNLIPLKSVRKKSVSIYDTLYKYLDEKSKDAFQKIIESNNINFENISEKFKILERINVVDSVSFNLVYQNENYKRIRRIDKAYKLDFNLILDLEKVFDFLKTDDEVFNEYLKSTKLLNNNAEYPENISLFFHSYQDEIVKYLNKKYKVLKMKDTDYKNFARLNIFYILFVYDYYLFYRKSQNLVDKEKAFFFKELKTDIYFKM